MNPAAFPEDLVILASDKNIQHALEGLLTRPNDLAIRPITKNILICPRRDPGVFRQAHELLRPYLKKARYALAILDREGCGREDLSREQIEKQIEKNLEKNGWRNRSAAVAIDPELETWVWRPSPHVPSVLGWGKDYTRMENWLKQQKFLQPDDRKPCRPKEAMEAALRHTKTARSSSLYRELAEKVRFEECIDPAFRKLRMTLQNWFPPNTESF